MLRANVVLFYMPNFSPKPNSNFYTDCGEQFFVNGLNRVGALEVLEQKKAWALKPMLKLTN